MAKMICCRTSTVLTLLLLPLLLATISPGVQRGHYDELATEVLREMVEIRSSAMFPENTVGLLKAVVARLRAEGFDDSDITMVPTDVGNLVVRYRGSGAREPILVMAHIDVVDADPSDWIADPFTLAVIDGYYYGRGTTDNKSGAATLIVNFIRLRREGYVPDRDLIMVLTGDEESHADGIRYLVQERPELVKAELALNTDTKSGNLDANGEPQIQFVQTSEKVFQTFVLEATNPGGHSSVPSPNNAIYRLANALVRLEGYRFPVEINEATRMMMSREADLTPGELGQLLLAAAQELPDPESLRRLAAQDLYHNALMRTTCVATMLEAGHAENALPRVARATVNCRILPGHSPMETLATLREVIADDGIIIHTARGLPPSPPSPLREDVMGAIGAVTQVLWPGTVVSPEMSTGYTDGLWVRRAGIPVYAVSGLFEIPGENRAHGLDERIGVETFHRGVEFWYRLLKQFSS